MNKINVIAEIGINHNGDLKLAKKLIDIASIAGCDYVKFQKRTPEVCVPEEQKSKMKSTPWGEMTYIDYKHKTEFGLYEYREIDKYCKEREIKWFASVWDKESVDFFKEKFPHIELMKIPSALITDLDLCMYAKNNCKTLMISTGMSTEKEIQDVILKINPDVVFHTNSSYPSKIEELNLNYITWLKNNYEFRGNTKPRQFGYSGHEYGLITTYATATMGIEWIERHITLDRNMWGSDQMASVEPGGLIKLVKGIRDINKAMGYTGPRQVLGSELSKRKSLRG